MPDAVADIGSPSEEETIRGVLASIPVGRLRKAGLLGTLLELADAGGEDEAAPTADGASIDEMDAQALIRMAQEDVA